MAGNDIEHGGLSRAVRADDGVNAALFDRSGASVAPQTEQADIRDSDQIEALLSATEASL